MATKKTGTLTGSNLDRKTGKGKLTNSQRFDKPKIETNNSPSMAYEASTQKADNNARAKIKERFSSGSVSNNSNPLATGDYQQALSQGQGFATKLGIQEVEIGELLGSDPYQADSSAPQLSASEANQRKLIIQKQNNALDVRLEKVKQGRKVMSIAIEQRRLVADAVTYETAGVEIGTRVIQHEIANTKFNIEQSKLVQTQELLTQQQIATEGTISLTPGIQEEWELKLERQQAKNQGLRLEIEGAYGELERKREQMEAKLLLIGE